LCFLIGFLLLPSVRAYEPPQVPVPRPFNFDTDTFAFSNETVWNYVDGSVQADSSHEREHKRNYTRRCFVVSRAAVQFWKFARFDPEATPLDSEKLADRIRQVTERSVWLPALSYKERIVFPGCHSLREISSASASVFQANIGLGWPIYFRAGMMPIIAPVYRETEAQLNDEIFSDLQIKYPTIVWLYNFPSLDMNHAVVVFAGRHEGQKYIYRVYDPNYADAPKTLKYNADNRTFFYQPTFYFKGGSVSARAVYRGLLQ